MKITAGDTVKVLGNRNAFDEDISKWRSFPYNVGDTFVVGRVEEGTEYYPSGMVYPVDMDSDFWRADDLEVVERAVLPPREERIRNYRETLGIGLLEAKEKVRREDLLAEIEAAETVADLKAVLTAMVQAKKEAV